MVFQHDPEKVKLMEMEALYSHCLAMHDTADGSAKTEVERWNCAPNSDASRPLKASSSSVDEGAISRLLNIEKPETAHQYGVHSSKSPI